MWCHLVCSTSVVCLPTTLMTLCSLCLWERYLHVNEDTQLLWGRDVWVTGLLRGQGGLAGGRGGSPTGNMYQGRSACCSDHLRPDSNGTVAAQQIAHTQLAAN